MDLLSVARRAHRPRPLSVVGRSRSSVARRRNSPPPVAPLLEWCPGIAPDADLATGAAWRRYGSGLVLSKRKGHVGMYFGGSGSLWRTGLPFSALSDLSGGLSLYFVADRTANPSFAGLLTFSNGTSSERIYLAWAGGSASISAGLTDGGAAAYDTSAPALGLDTIGVVGMHALYGPTNAQVGAYVDGSGANYTAAAENDPSGLDRVCLGGLVHSVPTSPFTGWGFHAFAHPGPPSDEVVEWLSWLYPELA